MSDEIRSMLDKLYDREPERQALEKTAEARLFHDLQGSGDAVETVEENPYANMPYDELLKLANDLGSDVPQQIEEAVQADQVEEQAVSDEVLEKTAADIVGGKIMAHAMIHEFGLMKQAMADGNCRVCKSNPMDLEGSSICSGCLSEEQVA
jgi:hypothetical protein